MKVSVLGTGYVGLVSGTCFAEMGHHVTCIDVDSTKIETLKKGQLPIYEPGLKELLERNILAERLCFSTGHASLKEAKVVFLAVGTPSTETGEANLEYLYSAATSVAQNLEDGTIVVIKSTVPVGTAKKILVLLQKYTRKNFYLVNNPEFLKEGSAIDDFMRPDRVVIGHEEEYAAQIMEELYAPLVRQGNPIYKMSNISAEMTKYAANCFLATKISFINEMGRICDATGADIEEVRKGITSDKRIGPHFLYPGPGYGGSCFPKDVKALLTTAKQLNVEAKIIEAVEEVNQVQKTLLIQKIKKHFEGNIKGKTFAFWGVAFKPNTDDIRESAAIDMALGIIKEGGRVHYYDPVAGENFQKAMSVHSSKLERFHNRYDCLNEAHGLVVLTDWAEFKAPNFLEVKRRLKVPALFDGRNLYRTKDMLEHGFAYYALGKFIPNNIKIIKES